MTEREGLTTAEVSRRPGASVNLLPKWREIQGTGNAVSEMDVEEERRQLLEENRRLRMGREVLKKVAAFVRERKELRFQFIPRQIAINQRRLDRSKLVTI